jgi:hypothetical protein
MELSQSTIYTREYLYTTVNGYDIEFRALTYKELGNIRNKYLLKTHTYYIETVKLALLSPQTFAILVEKDIQKLHAIIMDMSIVSVNDIEDIETAVTISLEDTFQDETFSSCKACRARNLDEKRNCPYLEESTHDTGVFYVVGGKKLNMCPMDKVNNPIVADAFRCHNMLDKGILPATGGMYDQTMFFVETSALVKGIINRHTSKELNNKK